MVKSKKQVNRKGRKSNIPQAERVFCLYSKLINYRYKDYTEKPKTLIEIEQKVKESHKEKIESSYQKGWVTIGHIEREPWPYPESTADKKKYDFLNSPLIEKSKLIYLTKQRDKRSKSIYRLKRDMGSIACIIKVFQEHDKIWELVESDYYSDLIEPIATLMLLSEKYFEPIIGRGNNQAHIEATKVLSEKLKNFQIFPSPSFIKAFFNRKLPNVSKKYLMGDNTRLSNISFQELLLSFYIYDYVNEQNTKLKEKFKIAIDIIKQTGG